LVSTNSALLSPEREREREREKLDLINYSFPLLDIERLKFENEI
jgi:hypothetical protein